MYYVITRKNLMCGCRHAAVSCTDCSLLPTICDSTTLTPACMFFSGDKLVEQRSLACVLKLGRVPGKLGLSQLTSCWTYTRLGTGSMASTKSSHLFSTV
jgi:hypothetical protein